MTQKRARRVLLCVTGGYQSWALPGFVLQLLHHFADDVQIVLTRAAAGLVSQQALEVASRNKVFVEMDDRSDEIYVPHIELSRAADLILVYPATVSIVGKVANGISDELVSALVIAAEIPVFFVPISNPAMIAHPAMQRNMAQLRTDGYTVLPPMKATEVATREGLDESTGPFPMPTLLLQMSSALSRGQEKA